MKKPISLVIHSGSLKLTTPMPLIPVILRDTSRHVDRMLSLARTYPADQRQVVADICFATMAHVVEQKLHEDPMSLLPQLEVIYDCVIWTMWKEMSFAMLRGLSGKTLTATFTGAANERFIAFTVSG